MSPSVGHLVAGGLCPALGALLGDGLKPFQKDVIVGRRRLSPWHLVEASANTGKGAGLWGRGRSDGGRCEAPPSPSAGPEPLRLLFGTVTRLQPLRDPHRRFNAFIFSLLK